MSDAVPSPMEQVDELEQLANWQHAGRAVALATVVRTWGSSPRPVGSHLVVDDQGAFVGSVSGGCIEGAVVAEALTVISDGRPRKLEFGVSDDQAWEVGLSCGGTIHVYLESLGRESLGQLQQARQHNNSVARIIRLSDGCQAQLCNGHLTGELLLDKAQLAETATLLQGGRSGLLQTSQDELFVRSYVVPARMMIVGAVHIAQALAPMAILAGYDVTVIDPRTAFAREERFPGVSLSHDWPDEALQSLSLDSQTALVTLSHDPKLDDPALMVALKSRAFYIGSLGSTRTHAKRVQRLTEAGLGDQLARIQAPVGMSLGGRAPAEIAVAILAQVIKARYSGDNHFGGAK